MHLLKEAGFDVSSWANYKGKHAASNAPAFSPPDIELSYYEGKQRVQFILHRRREAQLRRDKIAEALARDGKLVCEVPNCEFDFKERYGPLGEGYAQVHHRIPPLEGLLSA